MTVPSRNSVWVVGSGTVSPVGTNAVMTASSVRNRVSGIAHHPWMVLRTGKSVKAARANFLNEPEECVERMSGLAQLAVDDCLRQIPTEFRSDLAWVVAIPGERVGVEGDAAGRVRSAMESVEGFKATDFRMLTGGHAAGMSAITQGIEMIQSGQARIVVAGGVDSWMSRATIEWLDEVDRINSDQNRWGLFPGEAASFCILASESALKDGLPGLSRVLSSGRGVEEAREYSEDVVIGAGLTQALRACLESESGPVDRVLIDMNGSRFRVDEFGFSALRIGEHLAEGWSFETPSAYCGDVGVASGPLFMSLISEWSRRPSSRIPFSLIVASDWSGERLALMLEAA